VEKLLVANFFSANKVGKVELTLYPFVSLIRRRRQKTIGDHYFVIAKITKRIAPCEK
jgi:hypothetical protein